MLRGPRGHGGDSSELSPCSAEPACVYSYWSALQVFSLMFAALRYGSAEKTGGHVRVCFGCLF